jgi:septal ring-binding cell division protein DamX
VIPLDEAGRVASDAHDVHVPLAHQSAMAGVLLAGALLRHASIGAPTVTTITRLNVLRVVGEVPTQPARAAHDGRCSCEDDDFRAVYRASTRPRATSAATDAPSPQTTSGSSRCATSV